MNDTIKAPDSYFLGISLLKTKLLVPSDLIQGRLVPPKPLAVPLTVPWILGLIHWHEKLVTLIDVNEMLGGDSGNRPSEVIIVEHELAYYGLLFEQVFSQHRALSDSQTDKIPLEMPSALAEITASYTFIEAEPWPIISLQRLFQQNQFNAIALLPSH